MPRMTTFVEFRNVSVHPFTPGNIELVFTPDDTESEPDCELPRAIYRNYDWFNPGGSNTFVLFGTNNAGIYAPPFLTCSCVNPREEPPSVVYPGCTACIDEKYAIAWRLDTKIELANPFWLDTRNLCNVNWESDDLCRNAGATGVEAVRWLIYRGLGEVKLLLKPAADDSGLPTQVGASQELSTSGYFFVPAQWGAEMPVVPCTPGGSPISCPVEGPFSQDGTTGAGVRVVFNLCSGVLEVEVYGVSYSKSTVTPTAPIVITVSVVARWVYKPEEAERDCTVPTRLRLWDETTMDWDISNVRTAGYISTHHESGFYVTSKPRST